MTRLSLRLAAALATLALAPAARAGEKGGEPCAHCPPPAKAADAAPAPAPSAAATQVTLVDAPLVDQDGRAVRFTADVVGDRIVVMDFVFTRCTTVCPVLSGILARLQADLGDAPDVALVSVSIDPRHDTPDRLLETARKHGAGPRWTWVGGAPEEVEKVLKGLGAYTPDFRRHTPMVLVGDGRTGQFRRLVGFPSRAQILAQVDDLRAARRGSAPTAASTR